MTCLYVAPLPLLYSFSFFERDNDLYTKVPPFGFFHERIKLMNKLFTKIAGAVACFAMAIGVGVGVAGKQAQRVFADPGDVTPLGAESFDSSDFTSGSSYQGTVTEGPENATWTIYYGCFSTSSAITGTRSAAIRLYTSNNYGYLKTNFSTSYVSKVVFNAKAATSNSAAIKMNVEYSTNGTSWSYMKQTSATGSDYHAIKPSSSASEITAYMPSAVNGNLETVYLRWSIDSSSTKPSTKNAQLTIDDINIYVMEQSLTKTLDSIALSGTYPTSFYVGDAFSHEGMTVTANYDDNSHRDVTADATFTGYNMSQVGEQIVTVSYTEEAVTKTATYGITVNPARTLSSISLSGTYPTTFESGAAFSHEGMTVTANYDDNSHRDVTADATFTGYNMSQVGEQTVTVSYTEEAVTKTATYGITVTYAKGTQQNPYTVSEAYAEIAKIPGAQSNNSVSNGQIVYVAGRVTGTPTSANSGQGATFDITDGSKTIKAYSITGASATDTTSEYYVEAGYEVLVAGALINYHKGTYEVGYTSGFNTSIVYSHAPTYSVTYDANGATSGTVPVDDTEYPKYSEVTVASNTGTLAKTNYQFNGWNTHADPTSLGATHYNAGNSFTITADITLYAEWLSTSPSITVQSELEGYTGQSIDLDFTYGNIANASNISIVAADNKVTVQEWIAENNEGTVTVVFNTAGNTSLSFKNNGVELATCSVTVLQSGVTISGLPNSQRVYVGATLNLGTTITVTPSGICSNAVTWESSNQNIATVSSSGVVTGVDEGIVTITVASVDYPTAQMSCSVKVILRNNGTSLFYADLTTTMNVTDGFDIDGSSIVKKTGYYQDGGTATTSVNSIVVTSDSPLFNFEPESIKLVALLGAGENKNPLDYPVKACLIDDEGHDINSTVVEVATGLTKAESYITVEIPYSELAYGVKLTHVKEDSWNVRYYSFELSCRYTNSFATLVGNETNNQGNISVDSVAIKFGTTIAKDQWDAIDNSCGGITGYGVMLFKEINPANTYSDTPVFDAYNSGKALNIVRDNSGQVPYEEGNNYKFYVKVNVTNHNVVFCAAPFVVAGGRIYFLDEMQYSVNTLAQYHLTHGGSSLSNDALELLASN